MAAINTTARAQDQFKSLDDMMDPERDELGAGTHAPAQVAPDAYPLELLMEHTLAPLRAGEDVPTDLPSWEEEAPWEAIRIPAKTLDDLEWSQLLEHLAYGTVSSQGRELAFGLRPLPNRAAVERRMREISESQALLDQSDAPPLPGACGAPGRAGRRGSVGDRAQLRRGVARRAVLLTPREPHPVSGERGDVAGPVRRAALDAEHGGGARRQAVGQGEPGSWAAAAPGAAAA
jgi:hypothetical protein